MNKELAEAVKLFISQPLNFPLSRGQIMEVARTALPILEQRERGEGEWKEWGGGRESPINPGDICDIKCRDGEFFRRLEDYQLHWKHDGTSADIIAYRIIPERATNQERKP